MIEGALGDAVRHVRWYELKVKMCLKTAVMRLKKENIYLGRARGAKISCDANSFGRKCVEIKCSLIFE